MCYCLNGLYRPSDVQRRRQLRHVGVVSTAAQKVFSIDELHDEILAKCPFVKAFKLGASEDQLCRRWVAEDLTAEDLWARSKRKHLTGILKVLRAGGIALDNSLRGCAFAFRSLVRDVYNLCDHHLSKIAPGLHPWAISYNVLRIMSGFGGLAYAN